MRRDDDGGSTPIEYVEGGKLRSHTTIEHTAYSSSHPIHWPGPWPNARIVRYICTC
jgi:hypothetical protein